MLIKMLISNFDGNGIRQKIKWKLSIKISNFNHKYNDEIKLLPLPVE